MSTEATWGRTGIVVSSHTLTGSDPSSESISMPFLRAGSLSEQDHHLRVGGQPLSTGWVDGVRNCDHLVKAARQVLTQERVVVRDPVAPQVQVGKRLKNLASQTSAGEGIAKASPPKLLVTARKEALPERERQRGEDLGTLARIALSLQADKHAAHLCDPMRAQRRWIEQPALLDRRLRLNGSKLTVDCVPERNLKKMQRGKAGSGDARVPEVEVEGERPIAVRTLQERREALLGDPCVGLGRVHERCYSDSERPSTPLSFGMMRLGLFCCRPPGYAAKSGCTSATPRRTPQAPSHVAYGRWCADGWETESLQVRRFFLARSLVIGVPVQLGLRAIEPYQQRSQAMVEETSSG